MSTRSQYLSELNRASAKANAYANCGTPQPAKAAAWQREHVRLLNGGATVRSAPPVSQSIWAWLARITEPKG